MYRRCCGDVFEMSDRNGEKIRASTWSVSITMGFSMGSSCSGDGDALHVSGGCGTHVRAGRGSFRERARENEGAKGAGDDDGSEIGRRPDGSGKGGDKCLHDKCVSCVRQKCEMLRPCEPCNESSRKRRCHRERPDRATLFPLPLPPHLEIARSPSSFTGCGILNRGQITSSNGKFSARDRLVYRPLSEI